MNILIPDLEPLIISAVQIALSVLAGLLIHYIALRLINQFAKLYFNLQDKTFFWKFNKPSRLLVVLLCLRFTIPLTVIPLEIKNIIDHMLNISLILSMAWLLLRITFVTADFTVTFFENSVKDSLRVRGILTQISFFKRLVVISIFIISIAAVMMTFHEVRKLGAGILASAGVIGIIVGLAAQRTIGNLLGGLQIAITQPIKFDDVVVIEGEWGIIEEITLTYIVVKMWDLKRLIVPIATFIEKPFQNWSRVTTELLGSVFIYVDYTAPVQTIREELIKIVEATGRWDGKVCDLRVTNTSEKAMELRAVVSAANTDNLWEIRCEVREKLVGFVQQNYPECLPTCRETQRRIN